MLLSRVIILAGLLVTVSAVLRRQKNEYIPSSGATHVTQPLPNPDQELPLEWDWNNVKGISYLTKTLNQHIPNYCGSCWAHASLSALGDRIKIARQARGVEINLSIQYVLNCGRYIAGSCNGGSALGVYELIHDHTGYVPFDTCLSYQACSADSTEPRCQQNNNTWTCTAENTCRTCNTFTSMGGFCAGVSTFPNASIADFGIVTGLEGVKQMQAEIYERGPIACNVDAGPILNYTGGIYTGEPGFEMIDHVISVYGWGHDNKTNTDYWRVRNSWGEYWGEMGMFRVEMGKNLLGIEDICSWATPKAWTEHNTPCYEDGTNCVPN